MVNNGFKKEYITGRKDQWDIDREFDKLVEGRMKKLSGINLKEEIDFMDNISTISDRDGDEVFGE